MIKNPSIILSPLPFYDTIEGQHRRITSTFNNPFCLYASNLALMPFQLNIDYVPSAMVESAILIYSDGSLETDITADLLPYIRTGEWVERGITGVAYTGGATLANLPFGRAYLKLQIAGETYFSEEMVLTNVFDCITLEYYDQENLYADAGLILYEGGYKNRVYLPSTTEISTPEYNVVQEGNERAGRFYPTRRMFEKIFKFKINVPEFFCDSLAMFGVSDFKEIRTVTQRYEVDQFLATPKFISSAIATVECEFHTQAIIHKDARLLTDVWRVRGRVIDDLGNPVSGAAVKSGIVPQNWTAYTDSNGNFEQSWVANGTPLTFDVTVSKAGYTPNTISVGSLDPEIMVTPEGQFIGDLSIDLIAIAEWVGFVNILITDFPTDTDVATGLNIIRNRAGYPKYYSITEAFGSQPSITLNTWQNYTYTQRNARLTNFRLFVANEEDILGITPIQINEPTRPADREVRIRDDGSVAITDDGAVRILQI